MSFFSAWERVINPEGVILRTIRESRKDGLSGAELAQATGIGSSRLYPALASLERKGKLVSAWVDAPSPRRRLYHIRNSR